MCVLMLKNCNTNRTKCVYLYKTLYFIDRIVCVGAKQHQHSS